MYNNSTNPISLIYDPSYNVTSLMDLSNNSLFLNDYGISFLWTLLRNFCHPLYLTIINLFLRVEDKNNPCIRVIQENLIENSVQDSLPYIRIPNGPCELNLAYHK